jgi:hypothetical protein
MLQELIEDAYRILAAEVAMNAAMAAHGASLVQHVCSGERASEREREREEEDKKESLCLAGISGEGGGRSLVRCSC